MARVGRSVELDFFWFFCTKWVHAQTYPPLRQTLPSDSAINHITSIDIGTSREHKLHLRRSQFLGLFGGMKGARSAVAHAIVPSVDARRLLDTRMSFGYCTLMCSFIDLRFGF